MQKFLPFLQWLPNYKKIYFLKDLVAGFTVGIILVPQGMAYAMIAGLPPVYGLYASVFPLLVYVFLGTSRQLAIGPAAMDSLLVALGLGALTIASEASYIAMAIFLSFMVGVVQLFLGIFRIGFLANFLSKSVINGFTAAAALIIVFSQLKHLLGVAIERSNKFHELIINAVEHISETNMYDFALGILGMLAIIGLKKWNRKIPSILLVVVGAILAVYFLNLESYGVEIVGKIPAGLPTFQIPDIDLESTRMLWPMALTLALIGYLEAISIGKAMQEKEGHETIDVNQELIALGTSNLVGSFFQSYPVTGSFSRSAISGEAGTRTNLSALFTVALVVLTLLFLTPLFYYLPKAVLASIIMVAVIGLIDLSYAKKLWKDQRDEFVIWSITFLITLFIGIPQGIVLGVLLSLLIMVYRSSKPNFVALGKIKGSDYYKNVERFGDEVIVRDDLLIVRFDAQLYFGNAAFFKKRLLKYINEKEDRLKGVILNADAIHYIDTSGAQVLIKIIKQVRKRDLKFYISGAIGPTRDMIFNSEIINELHENSLFATMSEAVAHFDDPHSTSAALLKVANQNLTKGS
ncbi:Sulfate transporter 4.1, chloroplast precursor [hydrothermal vent metagenome]|uniref:Sulfate transporter 4.1, chloroplast n=1 Tax=hydrothermal vent metagenome TaxID=652676 RepID=A0A3B0T9V6_9ZZZZ